MSQIEFEKPSKSDPGFLRRTRKALEFLDGLKKDQTPELIDKMVDFLLPYVRLPEDRNLAREALLDASEEQFNQLLTTITGGEANPTSATPSGSTTG